METFKYSIIIPHRNSIDLLNRAINSIPKRTDSQIIIADNSDVELSYSDIRTDSLHIRIIHTPQSRGAGGARNEGILVAKGAHILFLDADDYFTENAFEYFDEYVDAGYDIVFYKWESCYSDTLEKSNRDIFYNSFLDEYLANPENEDNIRYRLDTPCGKMFSSKFLRDNNILFDECLACNDGFFSMKTGYYARNIHVSNKVVYCATVSKGSITNRRTIQHLESRFLANLRINQFIKEKGIKIKRPIIRLILDARAYGLRESIRFIKIALSYGVNPITGIIYILTKKKKMKISINEKYITK